MSQETSGLRGRSGAQGQTQEAVVQVVRLLTLAGVHLPDPGGDVRAASEVAGPTVVEKRRFSSKNWGKIIKRGTNNLACLLFI